MMSLSSLVYDVLDEEDNVWLEVDGERIEGSYKSHEIENDTVRINLASGESYRLGESLGEAEDFGLQERGTLYEALEDFGIYGENLESQLRDGASAANILKEAYEKNLEGTVAAD